MECCTNGADGWDFTQTLFAQCIETERQKISFFLGMASIAVWIGAQIPQLVINFRRREAEAVSALLMGQWFLGDTTNLIGAYLTNQLQTQKYLGIWFVFIDVSSLLQILYYRSIRPLLVTNRKAQVAAALAFLVILSSLDNNYHSVPEQSFPSRALLGCDEADTTSSTAQLGYGLGIVSAGCYLASRPPQIYTNYSRKSTVGLSFAMFVCAIFGNLFYSASILVWGGFEQGFLFDHAPWLVGSLGTVMMDFIIIYQFYIYRGKKPVEIYEMLETTSPQLRAQSDDSNEEDDDRPGLSVSPLTLLARASNYSAAYDNDGSPSDEYDLSDPFSQSPIVPSLSVDNPQENDIDDHSFENPSLFPLEGSPAVPEVTSSSPTRL